MKKTFYSHGFWRGNAFAKAVTCLLLASGGTGLCSAYAESVGTVAPSVSEMQQTKITVKGIVKDAQGEPIIGASVLETGTTNGVITDFDGNFSLSVKAGAQLTISYVGYVSQTVKASQNVNIVLEEDNKLINEVVVIGYGTQKKGDITSAITSIKSEDFTQGYIKDASDLIKGKVAGLSISNGSGDPNVESTIRLRGVISLQGSSTPLILVDGVEGGLTTVAPENIESIDVLKDASAAAIYGTRGANGVIIITTKAGKRESRTNVNYSGYMSLSAFGKKLDFMDGADIRAGHTNFIDKGYDTDWLDAVTRTAFTHNHNVSITGGNKQTAYSADFTYRNQEGVILNTYNEEMRFNAMLSHWMLNDMLKLQFNLVKDWHKNGPIDAAGAMVYRQAIMRNPTEPIYAEDGSYYENFGVNYYYNPVSILQEQKGNYTTETTRLTGNVTFEPIKGWQTNLMLATERYNNHDKKYYTTEYYNDLENNYDGEASQTLDEGRSDNLEITSTYKHQWGRHRFEALVGYSYLKNTYEGFYAYNRNFMDDFFEYNNLGSGTALKDGKASMTSYKNDDKLIGFFGRVSYGYADKYNALVSIRREGSSKFGANHKWGTFPSASLGWTISNEEFMKNITWLDNLKLRAGFGVTGVIPSESYLSLTRWDISSSYYYDKGTWKQQLTVASNPNPDLKWEKSTEYNVGIDWSVLSERLSGTIDLYHKTTRDLLWDYTVPVPPNLYSTTKANVGQLRNMGIEVSINAVPIRTKDFEWRTIVTASYNKNKLISLSNDLYETNSYIDTGYLGEPISLSTQRQEVGQPIGQFYGLKSVGVSENGLWMIENAKTGEAEEFTDNMLTDKETYYQKLGNSLPKVYLGWNNTFRYKDFDLSMQFTGQFGFKILNEARAYYENNTVNFNRLKSVLKSPYNSGYTLASNQKQTFVSYYLEDGDFLKCQNMTIGYNVPLKQNKYISKLRVYLSADNLFCITGYDGLDPELSNSDPMYSGIDWRDKYPSIRTFTFGLNVNF